STLTYPASVLPDGMTSPAYAVDGDRGTSWVPGPDGRMVTDLGSERTIGTIIATWDEIDAPALTISTSSDGVEFTDLASVEAGEQTSNTAGDVTARYVAISTNWASGNAALQSLQVLAPEEPNPELPSAEPALSVNPETVDAGEEVVVTATGFVPGEPITVAL